MKVKTLFIAASRNMHKNAPIILGGAAITTSILAVAEGIRATFKVGYLIDEYKYDILRLESMFEDDPTYLDIKKKEISTEEMVRVTWKEYIPTAVLTTAAVTSIFGSMYIHNKRNAALAGVYALSEARLKEYKDKVLANVGEKKVQKIREDISEDSIRKNPVEEVLTTGRGDYLCYDELSGRYFNSTIEDVKHVINLANELLIKGQNFISLNELYTMMGLPSIELGKDIGWNVDNLIEPYTSSHLASNGHPCLVLAFENTPHADYY